MGLLPSANYFQKSMGVYVLNDLLYKICEVYIDDMLILGRDDDNFISNVRTVFQRCREKNVALNVKKLTIAKDKVQFLGHEIDSCGINMSQKRIEGTIAFAEPSMLKELQSFLGLVNYFKDHLRKLFWLVFILDGGGSILTFFVKKIDNISNSFSVIFYSFLFVQSTNWKIRFLSENFFLRAWTKKLITVVIFAET
jgi:hypothetical protein